MTKHPIATPYTLRGGNGRDNLNGDSGKDHLDGGPDDDNVDGGSGRDVCTNSEIITRC